MVQAIVHLITAFVVSTTVYILMAGSGKGSTDSTMRAKAIIDEVKNEVLRRMPENREERLQYTEDMQFREWKIRRYTEAIEIDPSYAEAYVERGTELYLSGRPEEAKADMRKALSLHPSEIRFYMAISWPFGGEEGRRILQAGMELGEPSSLDYQLLRSNYIQTYWYDGNHEEYVRLLDEWLRQLDKSEFMYRLGLGMLGMGYSALGQHEKAEEVYRRQLEASSGDDRGLAVEMILRTRMHREQYRQGREILEEFTDYLSEDKKRVFSAVLAVLENPDLEDAVRMSNSALAIAEQIGKQPGPVGSATSYDSFLLGVIYFGANRRDEAKQIFHLFADESAQNAREWGVTMKWEIAKARQLAAAS